MVIALGGKGTLSDILCLHSSAISDMLKFLHSISYRVRISREDM